MSLQAQTAAQHAEWQHQALRAAQTITQAMRSNPSAMTQGAYTAEHSDATVSLTANHPCHIWACHPTARAEHDVLAWQAHLATQLPDGRGILQMTGPTQRRIVVMWSSPSANAGTTSQIAGWREQESAAAGSWAGSFPDDDQGFRQRPRKASATR